MQQISRSFTFQGFDKGLDAEISFRPVEISEDLERLHEWHHQDHVIPFWKQNFPLPVYESHLKKLLEDQHHTLYIGYLNGEPMSYWEAYWAKDDIIANYYTTDKNDQGIHLLIGPKAYIGKGLALPLLRAMTEFQFKHQQTNRIVAEPDVRNEKMIYIFEKCGFIPEKEIELPDKKGLLMFCDRDEFKRRFKDGEFIHQLPRN